MANLHKKINFIPTLLKLVSQNIIKVTTLRDQSIVALWPSALCISSWDWDFESRTTILLMSHSTIVWQVVICPNQMLENWYFSALKFSGVVTKLVSKNKIQIFGFWFLRPFYQGFLSLSKSEKGQVFCGELWVFFDWP